MQHTFDDTLSNKFKEAFDSHNEGFVDADWLLMKQKLLSNKKPFVLLSPFMAKAASVLLIVGLTAFVTYKLSLFSFEKKMNLVQAKELITKPDADKIQDIAILKENTLFNEKSLSESEKKISANISTINSSSSKRNKYASNISKIKSPTITEIEESAFNYSTNYSTISRKEVGTLAFAIDTFSRKAFENKRNDEFIAATNEMLFKDEKQKKKFNFSANISSFYNYSESQKSSNSNLGAGFISEYKITKNIGIHSGILLANNSLDSDLSSNNLFASADRDYLAEPTVNNGMPYKDVETVYSFFSIDIPVNVYFYHKNMFFSGGLSSIAYFNEQVEHTYQEVITESYFNSSTNSYDEMKVLSTVTENETTGNIKTFNLGRMLNLSTGYKFNRKKRNIILEPYAKIPLGKMTSHNIYYGHAGISLRYQF